MICILSFTECSLSTLKRQANEFTEASTSGEIIERRFDPKYWRLIFFYAAWGHRALNSALLGHLIYIGIQYLADRSFEKSFLAGDAVKCSCRNSFYVWALPQLCAVSDGERL